MNGIMSTILACTDGSAYASGLYQYASWAAQRLDSDVEILHVTDLHRERALMMDLSGSIGLDASLQLTEELAKLEETQSRLLRQQGKSILEEAERQMKLQGISNVTTCHRHGTLVETLEEIEKNYELVVIGKRGAHAESARNHLGANLERVVRSASRPILVSTRTFRSIRKLLIAYDGGPSAQKTIEYALHSPLLTGLDCLLLRAGHIDDKAAWYLEETAARLRAGGFNVTTIARNGSPEKVIAEVLDQENVDLLAMGAYGHSPIRALILGSTTTNMIRTSPVPVLLFR